MSHQDEAPTEGPAEGPAEGKDHAHPKPSDVDPATTQTLELTSDIKQRLRKLDKLEATYPELLRSYRVAHRRATAIEPFEKALRENTPLTSITDPTALVEYLNQLNLRAEMVMGELKRVSAEKDNLNKNNQQAELKLSKAEEELAILKSEIPTEAATDGPQTTELSTGDRAGDGPAPEKVKSPVASVLGMFSPIHKPQKSNENDEHKEKDNPGAFFSYDEESSQLDTKMVSKTQEIEKLQREIDTLKQDLTAANAYNENSLEKATIELNQSSNTFSAQPTLQTQLDSRSKDIATLTQRLETSQNQLKELEIKLAEERNSHATKLKHVEASLAISDQRANQLDAELTKTSAATIVSRKLIDDLNSQIVALRKDRSHSESMIQELTTKIDNRPPAKNQPTTITPTPQPVANSHGASGASRKKNKKKKGKGGISSAPEETPSEIVEAVLKAPASVDAAALESEIAKLREDVSEKDAQIESLSQRRKTEEDLREEIESLRENLIDIGQDYVVAKEKMKTLEAEKSEFKTQIAELEVKMITSASESKANGKMQGELEALQKEYNELKDKSATLQSDLGAAQNLAQTRFKDLSEFKDVLQKAQSELKGLRQESASLKSTKEELAARQKELKEAEKKEKDLRWDLGRAQQLSSDRETEIKSLREKLVVENNTRSQYENAQRVAGRDMRKSEAEKAELKTKAEAAERELAKVQEEVNRLRPRVKELEEQVHKLRREKSAAQEDVEFKIQQYTNAQGLLSSMRDQTTEMSVQLKESKSQAESLEEELAEVQRLLQERTREGETMRRLLADVDERADTKVRDMRGRMEAAIEERDRIEDESSTQARKRSRETEELKGKIRDLEREVRTLGHERNELEQREKDWHHRREELEAIEQNAETETTEMRSTVSQLRTALEASESHVRDAEKQRTELRKALDEARQTYECTNKELKVTQAKLSSRSSIDSNRSGANGVGVGIGDTMYLKTIMLQFLEQKDKRLRSQLVPVLGKLLKFDK